MQGRWKIPRGRGGGVLKAEILKAKYAGRRQGAKLKTFHGGGGGGMDIFWTCTLQLDGIYEMRCLQQQFVRTVGKSMLKPYVRR